MKKASTNLLKVMMTTILMIGCIFVAPLNNKVKAVAHYHESSGIIYSNLLDQTTLESFYDSDDERYLIPTGSYVVVENLVLNYDMAVGSDDEVNICLDDKTIDLNGHTFVNLKKLYLCDCGMNQTEHFYSYDETTHLASLTSTNTGNSVYGGSITNGGVVNSGEGVYECINFLGCHNNSFGALTNNYSSIKIDTCKFIGNYSEGNGGAFANSAGVANIINCLFERNYATNGGAIEIKSHVNIGACTIIGNIAQEKGGAIYLAPYPYSADHGADSYLSASEVIYNEAAIGGGIYIGGNNGESGILTIIYSDISNNTATNKGAGIYIQKHDPVPECCLVEGTKITMADGSTKKVEDIVVGDVVRTFNHNTGTYSDEAIMSTYKGEVKDSYFTLNFANGVKLNIHNEHALLEKDSLKYINVTHYDAKKYIGKYFYNANAGRFEELLSVTYHDENKEFYAIESAHNFNVIANDMLTVSEDMTDFTNIFELDEDLTINQEKKEADIAKYGTLKYEDCQLVSAELFDLMNIEYMPIMIGKGLTTMDELLERFADYYDEEPSIVNNPAIVGDTSGPDYETFTEGVDPGSLVVGYYVVIKDNKIGENQNNVYLEKDTIIKVIENATLMNIGVTLQKKKGKFATGVYTDALKDNFFSDKNAYEVTVEKSGTTYTYSLGSGVPETGVQGNSGYLMIGVVLALMGVIIALVLKNRKNK